MDGPSEPIVVIHGGSGVLSPEHYPPERVEAHFRVIRQALKKAYDVLAEQSQAGRITALEAAVEAVTILEDCPLFNAAHGAVFNLAGEIELEASVAVAGPSVADPTRRGAAVTLLKTVRNPIKLAKALYLDPKACPHVLLSGPDAERIAADKKLELVDPHHFWTRERWEEHRRGLGLPTEDPPPSLALQPPPAYPDDLHELPKGTVGCVVVDREGNVAVATSTGGKTNKNVGRIGDSPSMGSGFYADRVDRRSRGWRFWRRSKPVYAAVGGTGDGDYFIRQATAHEALARMRLCNESLDRAVKMAMVDLDGMNGMGGCIALSSDGQVSMRMTKEAAMFRGVIRGRDPHPRTALWRGDPVR